MLHHPAIGKRGLVVNQCAIAGQIGADILAKGGNAVDVGMVADFYRVEVH